jgi:hypothetical protein
LIDHDPIASKFVTLARHKLAFCVGLSSLYLIDSEGLRTFWNCFQIQERTARVCSAGN